MNAKTLPFLLSMAFGLATFAPNMISMANAEETSATKAVADGSEEAVQDTALAFTYSALDISMAIFESVNNKAKYEHEPLKQRFFIPPLMYIKPFETLPSPAKTSDGRYFVYTFSTLNSSQMMLAEAQAKINESRDPKDRIAGGQIGLQSPHKISFTIPAIKGAYILPNGNGRSRVRLDARTDLQLYIPREVHDEFLTTMNDGQKLQIKITLQGTTKQLSQKSISWRVDDLRKTDAFKEIQQGGGAFVSANAINNVIREVIAKQSTVSFSDPDVATTVQQTGDEIFAKFMNAMSDDYIDSRAKAEKLDEELREGAGIKAKDYQPLTLIWDIREQLKTVTDVTEANRVFREFAQNNREKISASGSGNYGTTSAAGSYDKEFANAETQAFSDDKSLRDFKQKLHDGQGKDAKIIARGLNLVDKTLFTNSLQYAASSVAFTVKEREDETELIRYVFVGKEESDRWLGMMNRQQASIDALRADLVIEKARADQNERDKVKIREDINRNAQVLNTIGNRVTTNEQHIDAERRVNLYVLVAHGQACPSGFRDLGMYGLISNKSNPTHPLGAGAGFNGDFIWEHPHICQRL